MRNPCEYINTCPSASGWCNIVVPARKICMPFVQSAIRNLRKEIARLTANNAKLATNLDTATASLEQAQRERDAAILDIPHECETCKWEKESLGFCREPCPHCDHCIKDNYNGGCYCSAEDWEWRGLCAENAEGQNGDE